MSGLNCLSILLLLVSAVSAYAQNATGAINGTVTDQQGAAIPNATVTAASKDTAAARKLSSGSEGGFTFDNLLPGDYQLKVEHEGFATQTQTVSVQVGATVTVPLSLTVGSTTQIIEVPGQGAVVNTVDAALGGIVNRDRVENLPLNGRSFLSIAGLEPGVSITYSPTSGPGNPNNFFQVSIAGAPQSMTSIYVDGARVNDRTTGGTSQNFSSESVQEFQISTFNFDLSTGTVSAGAATILSPTGSHQLQSRGIFFFP